MQVYLTAAVRDLVVVKVIQFLFGLVPPVQMAGFTPFFAQFFAFHLSTLLNLGHPLSLNQFSLFFLFHFFQVFFGPLRFLFLLTSRSRAILKTLSPSLPSTCLYHLTPFPFAHPSAISFNSSLSICSSDFCRQLFDRTCF